MLGIKSVGVQSETNFAALFEVVSIKKPLFLVSFLVALKHFVHSLVRQTSDFAHVRMVEPDVAGGDAVSGRGSVEHEAAQTVHRQARIGPAAVAHHVLREVPIVTA